MVMKIIHFCIEYILRLDGGPKTRNHKTRTILFFHDLFIVTLRESNKTCIDDFTVKIIPPWQLVIHGLRTLRFKHAHQFHAIICQ